ncbi:MULTISPECIES: ABC transporter substrate-binding protein [unclassified Vibrio]|uniref:ABC transporter substrate-binding protein n=1 Tax=Vibrio sp. HB236076 TaxID=3232307 RepID=A0AB39HEV4_9VIBR|nr:ABC transporter substrate-binding protein [Vibrio sp. HB161653]MDP5254062.1 ABC transporter substrate-binding protein [Vibrio sp. HB161653]
MSTLLTSALSQAETVQFYAWGGSAQVNGYLQWANQQLQQQYGITLNHVKLADTSDAVSRVLAEKAAGNDDRGSVDLIWINGENFAAMSRHHLLLKDWVADLPNFSLTNPDKNPAMTKDFGLDTQGQEAPWGKAAMVFYYNSRYIEAPPEDLQQLLAFAKQFPGRFTYPLPSDYLGITFLKYALLALNKDNTDPLYQPVTQANFERMTAPLWQYLDQLHPLMWRQGQYRLRQASQLQKLMSDQELLLSFSFTSAEIPSAVTRYDLPESIRTYAMKDGSLGNIHFVGIPYNTAHPEAAKKVVNFFLSPQAQAKKQQVSVWGDETVLDLSLLEPDIQAQFLPDVVLPSALPSGAYHALLPEPDASWADALREAWFERYGEHY